MNEEMMIRSSLCLSNEIKYHLTLLYIFRQTCKWGSTSLFTLNLTFNTHIPGLFFCLHLSTLLAP